MWLNNMNYRMMEFTFIITSLKQKTAAPLEPQLTNKQTNKEHLAIKLNPKLRITLNPSGAANTSKILATGNLCDNPGKKGQVNSETTTQGKGWYLQPTQVTQVVQLLQDGTSVHKIAVTLWSRSLRT